MTSLLRGIISIDPGTTTGLAIAHYGDSVPYTLRSVHEIQGGAEGFIRWVDNQWDTPWGQGSLLVVERFILRDNPFVPPLEQVKIEGILMGGFMGPVTAWQQRNQKSIVPDQVLKDHGLWQTGQPLGHKDGRDANDAIIHGLAYLITHRHIPTMVKYGLGEPE